MARRARGAAGRDWRRLAATGGDGLRLAAAGRDWRRWAAAGGDGLALKWAGGEFAAPLAELHAAWEATLLRHFGS